MKHSTILFTAALLLVSSAAMAQKVYVDYDREADLSSVATYGWVESDEDLRDTNELGHRKVVAAVDRHLAEAGLRKVLTNADVWVTYHTAEEENIRMDTSSFGYGYPSSWYWGGYWGGYRGGLGATSYSTTVSSYTEGTLVIDIWTDDPKEMVWRGIATAVVPANPGKAEKKLDKALDKMGKKFRKMQQKEAKS
ncbi:MAG: DUF4136 domain-containing protein [Thermoanaerobaculia bacterium]|nr:DUF4136 domain-containing protein [Thermoanaerobaculia bacterium]